MQGTSSGGVQKYVHFDEFQLPKFMIYKVVGVVVAAMGVVGFFALVRTPQA